MVEALRNFEVESHGCRWSILAYAEPVVPRSTLSPINPSCSSLHLSVPLFLYQTHIRAILLYIVQSSHKSIPIFYSLSSAFGLFDLYNYNQLFSKWCLLSVLIWEPPTLVSAFSEMTVLRLLQMTRETGQLLHL
jgi:hypothetical protein